MSFNFELLIPITMFIVIGWIVKVLSDNKLRKSALEKGNLDKNTMDLLFKNRTCRRDNSLKWGMVLIAIGLALIIARIIGDLEEEAALGLMLLLAGAALVIFHWSHSKKEETKEDSIVEIKEIPPEQQ